MYNSQRYEGVKPVYFNPYTLEVSSEKIDNAMYFASTSEYHLYRRLCSYFAHLDVNIEHQSQLLFGESRWRVDFKLTTDTSNAMLCKQFAKLCNLINGSQFESLNTLYIEYKGLQDANFLGKMGDLMSHHPTLAKTIILISQKTSAFGCKHKNKDIVGFLCKPIVSVEDFALCFNKAF
jgi:hypothetical protein